MQRRRFLAAGGALLLGACAAPTPTPVPPKPSGGHIIAAATRDLAYVKTWFNSQPITLGSLLGQPFLMAFWTYT